MLIFTDGNETWPSTGGGPVAITNSQQPVEVEVETGFMVDTDYTVTVTVFTEYANMSSSAGFSKSPACLYSYTLQLMNPWNACITVCKFVSFSIQLLSGFQLPVSVATEDSSGTSLLHS